MCGRYIHRFNDQSGPKRGSFADQALRESEAAARREAERKRLLDLLNNRNFDVHIYFDAGTPSEKTAEQLAHSLMFFTERSHRIGAIGPHTKPNHDLRIHDLEPQQVEQLLERLQGHGLSILVHPITGDELADHTTNALWIGQPLPLKLSALMPPKGNKPPSP